MNAKSNYTYPASDMQLHASDAAGLMKALGNESRLMILCVLAEGERSVSDLNTIVPLSQSALSQQLARLATTGPRKDAARIADYFLFTCRRARRQDYYPVARHLLWVRGLHHQGQ